MKTETLDALFEEYSSLKKRAALLSELMQYYDKETMTFDIPEKWKNSNSITDEIKRKTPKTPRHLVANKLYEALGYSECEGYLNWDKMGDNML